MSTFDLFLSHNGADKPWAERLAVAVEADRDGPPLRVFFDKWDVLPGSDVPMELEAGLQNSRYVGLILSQEALSSDWVALERSTAIYRDPRAKQRSLIPLLRRNCDIPDMLARLNRIDFRRDQDFDSGVAVLIGLLRGRPNMRGSITSVADLHFREDAALLRSQRTAFERPAFKTACIWELFLSQLDEALDDTLSAINTGSLYSRKGTLLASFSDKNQYITEEFKSTFNDVSALITSLKRTLNEFQFFFSRVNPEYSHHSNFYAMLMGSLDNVEISDVKKIVNFMDKIDAQRNEILDRLNILLAKTGDTLFTKIELSSDILRKGHIGGSREVMALLQRS